MNINFIDGTIYDINKIININNNLKYLNKNK